MSPVSRYLPPPPCIVSYSRYLLGNINFAAGDRVANVGPGNVVYLLENESSFAILTPPPVLCLILGIFSGNINFAAGDRVAKVGPGNGVY